MAERKHTPGPWLAKEVRGASVMITVVGPDVDICKRVYRQGVPHTEGRANAQLIAAAPDMLAALEAGVEFLGGVDGAVGIRAVLLSAIAKAEAPL